MKENKQAVKLQILRLKCFSSSSCCQTLLSSGDINHNVMDREFSQLHILSRVLIKRLKMPSMREK